MAWKICLGLESLDGRIEILPWNWGAALPRILVSGYAIEAIEGVGEFADEEDEGGGLGIGFGAALLPFFEGAFVDAEFAGEDGAGAAEAAAGVANELGVHFG